jgi:hypothetical protein
MVMRIRIHKPGRDAVEALRRLPVAFLELWTQVARPAAYGVDPQQRETPALIYFPQFQFRLFLEHPN